MTGEQNRLAEREAMEVALRLACASGIPLGPNPRVGCVVIDPTGEIVAHGRHRGAGTPHAEVDALALAGKRARGATVVVTLEPCHHTGRTGPCTAALLAAGVRRVVYSMADPNPVAAGGGAALAASGVEVDSGLLEDQARQLNRAWLFGLQNGRPMVTLKFASSLDGRSAAVDGSSRWISNPAARADTHRLRAQVDTVMIGTGTAMSDDPLLTVRDEQGVPAPHQPLRVVMGKRELPPRLKLFDDPTRPGPAALQLRTHDPRGALEHLFGCGRRHVLVEGGPTLAAVFLRARLVDEIVAYLAPALLGSGPAVVGHLGVRSISEAVRPILVDMQVLDGTDGTNSTEPNVRLTLALPRPDPDP